MLWWRTASTVFGVLATVAALTVAPVRAGGVEGPTAIAGSGHSIWVSDSAGEVLRLDARTRRLVATTTVPGYPHALVTDSRSVWVATVQPGFVVRISRRTNRIVGQPISVGGGDPIGLASGPRTLWAVTAQDDRVWRIDSRLGKVDGSTVISRTPWLTAAVAAAGTGAWVAFSERQTSSTLVRLDVRGHVLARRQLPHLEITSIALAGTTLLVLAGSPGALLRLDSRTGRSVASAIRVGRTPTALAIDGDRVWIANIDGQRAVKAIDIRRGSTTPPAFRVPGRDGRADGLAIAAGYLWVTNAYGIVSQINPRTGRVSGHPRRVP